MKTEKRMVFILTAWLREKDKNGEEINWSSMSEEYYAETMEEAVRKKERLLREDENIAEVWISGDCD